MPSAFLIPILSGTYPLAIFIPVCQYIDMVCIYCGAKTAVTNSRPQKRSMQTWRRRQCTTCNAIFTTIEGADLSTSLVVRAGSAVEPFLRDKLFVSILRAIGHRTEPLQDAGSLTATVIAQLLHTDAKASYTAHNIAILTHTALERFDTAAAIQYQAYHTKSLKKT
jgi:transcriptional regulator NrdR family protein